MPEKEVASYVPGLPSVNFPLSSPFTVACFDVKKPDARELYSGVASNTVRPASASNRSMLVSKLFSRMLKNLDSSVYALFSILDTSSRSLIERTRFGSQSCLFIT